MIELVATSASRSLLSQLPEGPRAGFVHSVFTHAVNLKWGEDGWISLLIPPVELNPYGILVRDLPYVRVSDLFTVSREGVFLGGGSVWIRLDEAAVCDLRLLPVKDVPEGAFKSHRSMLCKMLSTSNLPPSLLNRLLGIDGGEGSPLLEQGSEIIASALASRHHTGIAQHLLCIVGLGEGLTPAGDDFLVGVLAGSAAFRGEDRVRKLLVGEIPRRARCRTTALSRRMLEAACKGEFSEPVIRVVRAFALEQRFVRRAMRDILLVGATSGADTLAGILFYMDRFMTEQP